MKLKPVRGKWLNPTHPLSRGLTLALLFDAGGGNFLIDRSLNKFGINPFQGTPEWSDGLDGMGVYFAGEGAGEYVTVPYNSKFGQDDFTISCLCRRETDTGVAEIIVDERDANDDGWGLRIEAADTITFSYNTNDATSTDTFAVGEWRHLIGVSRAGTNNLKLFSDGVELATATRSGNIAVSVNLHIATRSYTQIRNFIGTIAHVMYWDRWLSDGEVLQFTADPYQMFGVRPSVRSLKYRQYDYQRLRNRR